MGGKPALAGIYQRAAEIMACNIMTDDALAGIVGFMNKQLSGIST